MNENCSIGYGIFDGTPIESTYQYNMGNDKYCLDTYYQFCDNKTYIYVFNLNIPNICTIANATYFYYIDA